MTSSGVITRTAAITAAQVATEFMIRRYLLMRLRTNSPLSDIGPRWHAARCHPHQAARDHIYDQRDQEQRQPDLYDGAQVQVRAGFTEFVCDHAGHGHTRRE